MSKANKWTDHYTKRAKKENWLARSVYKLEEIDNKFKLIRPGYHILDLGCYPGSWSQYCVKKTGKQGEVVGIDLLNPNQFSAPNFRFIKADILLSDLEKLAVDIGKRDLVLSDMAPKTTGIHVADTSRSMELVERAYEIALEVLKKNGRFLCKVFEGEDLKAFKNQAAHHFKEFRLLRPKAVRKKSREVYLLGFGKIQT